MTDSAPIVAKREALSADTLLSGLHPGWSVERIDDAGLYFAFERIDPQTRRLKNPPPDIEDVAKFYARITDVTEEQFLTTAKSFSVALNMKRADQWIKACGVDRTPTIIVNGKYRLHVESAGGTDELIELVNWLVAKESKAAGVDAVSSDSK